MFKILNRVHRVILVSLVGMVLSLLPMPGEAQQPIQPVPLIPPPVDYLGSCQREPVLFDYFGPYCLNPVHWDVPELGLQRIGTWVFFNRADGSNDGGVVVGYTWQFQEGRYHYWLMTQIPHPERNFGGRFENIPPERVMRQG